MRRTPAPAPAPVTTVFVVSDVLAVTMQADDMLQPAAEPANEDEQWEDAWDGSDEQQRGATYQAVEDEEEDEAGPPSASLYSE